MSADDRIRLYLRHMIAAIDRIRSYTNGISEDEFMNNTMVQDAVVRNIEIVGEAANNIMKCDADISDRHPEIPWVTLYAMRNRVTHGYFTVDFGVVWKTIQTDFVELRPALERLLPPSQTPGSA